MTDSRNRNGRPEDPGGWGLATTQHYHNDGTRGQVPEIHEEGLAHTQRTLWTHFCPRKPTQFHLQMKVKH
jgi:hypothetical protein